MGTTPEFTAPAGVAPATIVRTEPGVLTAGWGEGKPTESILKRTWSDGSVDFKCAKCDYTHINFTGVFGHLAKHSTPESRAKNARFREKVAAQVDAKRPSPRNARDDVLYKLVMVNQLLAEITATVSTMEEENFEREASWRDRALKAERQLGEQKKKIKRLLET